MDRCPRPRKRVRRARTGAPSPYVCRASHGAQDAPPAVANLAVLAGHAVPARRDMGRDRHELLAVSASRRRASSCACSTTRESRDADRDARGDRVHPPRVRARCRARPAVRLPRPRPWAPQRAARATRSKLLLDPYGKAVTGARADGVRACTRTASATRTGSARATARASCRRSVVVNPYFDWGNDRPPDIAVARDASSTSCTSRGSRRRTPAVPPNLRGTYAGLAVPEVVDWFARARCDRGRADARAPVRARPLPRAARVCATTGVTTRSATSRRTTSTRATGDLGQQVQEFKQMVKTLHDAGIEVILDVVYNHTAEGNRLGPMLSFKGVDNEAYYRLSEDDRRYYVDYTGTGNTLNMRHPHVLQLLMDSLRYWVLEMHVDGFRFDLAADAGAHAARSRPAVGVLRRHPARPGHQSGEADRRAVGRRRRRLPGRQLPAVVVGVERPVPRHACATSGAARIRRSASSRRGSPGSSDLYEATGRRPSAIDQLRHLPRRLHARRPRVVQREAQRGERRGEPRRHRRQPFVELRASKVRPTIPTCHALRRRQQRNFLATLFLSQGVPMLLAGDEIGRTQHGNNNAYCQDNSISWIDWENVDEELLDVHVRAQRHPPVAAPCSGGAAGSRAARSTAPASSDIAWFKPDGNRMTEEDWQAGFAKTIGVFLNGDTLPWQDPARAPGAQRHRSSWSSTRTTSRSSSRSPPRSGGTSGRPRSTRRSAVRSSPCAPSPATVSTSSTVPSPCSAAPTRVREMGDRRRARRAVPHHRGADTGTAIVGDRPLHRGARHRGLPKPVHERRERAALPRVSGAELVSHAVVTTRWAQPEGQRVLQTAYVDAVSTAPDRQGLGLRDRWSCTIWPPGIDDYELGCLQTDLRGFYEPWGGSFGAAHSRVGANTDWYRRPTNAASWCSPRGDAPLDPDTQLTIEIQPLRIWE